MIASFLVLSDVRFGSLAALHYDNTRTAASGGKAHSRQSPHQYPVRLLINRLCNFLNCPKVSIKCGIDQPVAAARYFFWTRVFLAPLICHSSPVMGHNK